MSGYILGREMIVKKDKGRGLAGIGSKPNPIVTSGLHSSIYRTFTNLDDDGRPSTLAPPTLAVADSHNHSHNIVA
jgi:hypothetical protein